MRRLLLVLVLCMMLNFAGAVCNQIPINDFEDAATTNWRVLYDEIDSGLKINNSGYSSNYSIMFWKNGGGVGDFTKERLNITLSGDKGYPHYNISFKYFANCPVSGDGKFYMSSESTFETWAGVGVTYPLVCGGWTNVSISPYLDYTWKSESFSFNSTAIRSITFENPSGVVRYDDIMLIPTIPEVCCDESWSCTGWSKCYENDTQHRECDDMSHCGTELLKPDTLRSCNCNPIWVCTEWEICQAGVVARDCSDLNLCEQEGSPSTSKSCTAPVELHSEMSSYNANIGEDLLIRANISGRLISQANLHMVNPPYEDVLEMGVEDGTYLSNYTITRIGRYAPYIEVISSQGDGSWFVLEGFTAYENLDFEVDLDASAYRQGDPIVIRGASGSSNCTLEMTFRSGLWQKSIAYGVNSSFSVNYTIGVEDPIGDWTVEVVCKDGERMGKELFEIEVVETVMFPYLSITSLQPEDGGKYYQGDSISVTAQVRLSGQLVPGATTFLVVPDGRRIVMNESGFGNYYTQFRLSSDQETGDMTVYVKSVNGTHYGEGNRTFLIAEKGIFAEFVGISADYSLVGTKVHVVVKLFRPDGEPVSGAQLKASIPGSNLTLVERTTGIYDSYFTPTEPYEEGWVIFLYGVDDLEYGRFEVRVQYPSLVDLVAGNLHIVAFLAISFIIVMIYFKLKIIPSAVNRIVKKRIRRMKEMQQDLRDSYFNYGDITRKAFNRRNRDLEDKISKLKKRIGQ